MKNMTKFLKGRSLKPSQQYLWCRGRDEWDSIKLNPWENPEYNEEPTDEDFVREVFEKHYYHFHHKAMFADSHQHKNQFAKMREWQHLYAMPE
jgi:hypothetical protein